MENEQNTPETAEQIVPAMYQSLDGDDAAAAQAEPEPDDELFHPRTGGRHFFEPLDWDMD